MKVIPLQVLATPLVAVGVCRAEVYKYTDGKGELHFVDDISKVPKKYRKQVENVVRRDDSLPSVKVKKKFLEELMGTLARAGIDPENVMVCFKETSWENWAFAGGRLIHT